VVLHLGIFDLEEQVLAQDRRLVSLEAQLQRDGPMERARLPRHEEEVESLKYALSWLNHENRARNGCSHSTILTNENHTILSDPWSFCEIGLSHFYKNDPITPNLETEKACSL
jgi:hypothetical protein